MIARTSHELDDEELKELAAKMVKYLGLLDFPRQDITYPEGEGMIDKSLEDFNALVKPHSRETLLAALKTLRLDIQNKIFSKIKSVRRNSPIVHGTPSTGTLIYKPGKNAARCFAMQCQILRSKFEVINGLADVYKSLFDHFKERQQSLWDEVILQARVAEIGHDQSIEVGSAKYLLLYGVACLDKKQHERAIDAIIEAMKLDKSLTPLVAELADGEAPVEKPDLAKLKSLFNSEKKSVMINALIYLAQNPDEYDFYREFTLIIIKNIRLLLLIEDYSKRMVYFICSDMVNKIGRNILNPYCISALALAGWEHLKKSSNFVSALIKAIELFARKTQDEFTHEDYKQHAESLVKYGEQCKRINPDKSMIAEIQNEVASSELLQARLELLERRCNEIQLKSSDEKSEIIIPDYESYIESYSKCIVGSYSSDTPIDPDEYYLRAFTFMSSSCHESSHEGKLYSCGMAVYDINKCFQLRPEHDEVRPAIKGKSEKMPLLSRNRLKTDKMFLELRDAGPDFLFDAIMTTNEMQQLHIFESCLTPDNSARSIFAEVLQSKSEEMGRRVSYLKTVNQNTDANITEERALKLAEMMMNAMIPTQHNKEFDHGLFSDPRCPIVKRLRNYFEKHPDCDSFIDAIDALPRKLRLKFLNSEVADYIRKIVVKNRPEAAKFLDNRFKRLSILNGKNDDELTTEDWQKLVEFYVGVGSQRALIMAAYSSERGLELCPDKDELNLKLASLIIKSGIGYEAFDRLIAKYPQSANLYFGRALCHLHAKKYIEAIYDICRSGVSKESLKQAISSVGCEDITTVSPGKILKNLRSNKSLSLKEKLNILDFILFKVDMFNLSDRQKAEIAEMYANLRTEIARDNQPSPVFSHALTFFSRGVDQAGNSEVALEVSKQEAKKSHEIDKQEVESTIFSLDL